MLPSAALLLLATVVGHAPTLTAATSTDVPPYTGTVFIDPDVIVPSDPSALLDMTYAGRGERTMYDRRTADWVVLDAYLFDARFSDGLGSEVQVNPEFGSVAAAERVAAKYAHMLGRLPTVLRTDVETVWIHRGQEDWGGRNDNLLIHVDQYATAPAFADFEEEVMVHEAAHTSLDAAHAEAPDWLSAQSADGGFVSTYARDHPFREDVAESFLPWLAVRYRPERVSVADRRKILDAIPNRLAYFDRHVADRAMFPITPVGTLPPDPGDTAEDSALLPIGPPLAATIGDADDIDMFRVDLQGRATLEVRTSGPTDTRGELLDAMGARIVADDDSGPGGRNFLVRADLEAGVYYVAVTGEPGDYAVMARLGDAPDHGGTPVTATLLTLYADAELDRVSPRALFAAPGRIAPTSADVDVFRLDVPLDGTDVTVRSAGGTDVFGRLLDASLNELAADTSDGNFRMAATLDAGTYYVVVTALETGTYRVLASGASASCPCDTRPAPDHGSTAESSTLMPVGPPLPGTIGSVDDVDVFRIDLQGSATLEVRTSGRTDVRGELLDGTGARIAADDDSGPGGRNFLVRADLEAGVYYVAVTGETGDYAVMARLGDAPDHGATEATSTLLTLYAEADLDRVSPSALLAAPGRIAPTRDDVDVFRLDVPEDGMAVTVRSAGATDVFARLLDSSLDQVASDDSDGNFRIEKRLDKGIYYLAVAATETGTYRVLAWGESPCPCATAPPTTGGELPTTGACSTWSHTEPRTAGLRRSQSRTCWATAAAGIARSPAIRPSKRAN